MPRPSPERLPETGSRVRLGVVGWPVGHSRSPAIQNAALRAAGLEAWRYSLLPVPPARFTETMLALAARGFRGVNVTIPHKEAALALAGEAEVAAEAIGAANTLLFQPGGAIRAANTDAPALTQALPLRPAGRSALVLGAGGSARAAVWALREAGASEVRLWNRTPERGRRLCEELGARFDGAQAGRLEAAEILVNCTPLGMAPGSSSLKGFPIGADALGEFLCVVDFVYRQDDTPLIQSARSRGIPVVDGLELLVRQGALSFALFTGRPAPLAVMRDAVRAAPAEVIA